MIYEVNCIGPVTVTHTLLPELLARPEAHIVNIASASALLPLPFAATYASSKWAVLGFSESLLEELRLTGHSMCMSRRSVPATSRPECLRESKLRS